MRSCTVQFENKLDNSLKMVTQKIEGKWDVAAPTNIAAHSAAEWKTENAYAAHGTEGWVTYDIEGTDASVHVHWDVPYAGTITMECNPPAGYVCYVGGDASGKTPTVKFTLVQP
jgi:hypothetical protein